MAPRVGAMCWWTLFAVLTVSHASRVVPRIGRHTDDQLALSQLQSARQAKRNLATEAVQNRSSSLPVPQIRHLKTPGQGYSQNSPLYQMQRAREALGVHLRGQGTSVDGTTVMLVPTTMHCVLFLTTQFFAVYSIYFVIQTMNRFKLCDRDREEKCLASVAETVYFVPMLSVLFIAARMRAVQLAQGEPDKYGLPPWWMKAAMYSCAWSLLVQTILVYVCRATYGDLWPAAVRKQGEGMGLCAKFSVLARNLVMLNIYVSFTIVCVGICIMQPPSELWGEGGGPKVSPAVFCTIFFTVLYFAVYLASLLAKTANDTGLFGPTRRFSYAQELLKAATKQVELAPMLCVLFIAVRLRALQFDPVHGNPQPWVQVSFYVCTFSVFLRMLLTVASIVLGLPVDTEVDGGEDPVKSVDTTGRDMRASYLKIAIDVVLFLLIAALYCGLFVIIFGLLTMEPGDGRPLTSLPTSLRCTVALVTLYFSVFCAIWVLSFIVGPRQGGTDGLAALKLFFEERAKEAVSFCPMFCVLFLLTLMRTLQVTHGHGTPQTWCEDCMCVATWSIVILTLARADSVVLNSPRIFANICTTLQYVCLAVLYICAVAVVVAIYTITPETANGAAAFFVN